MPHVCATVCVFVFLYVCVGHLTADSQLSFGFICLFCLEFLAIAVAAFRPRSSLPFRFDFNESI